MNDINIYLEENNIFTVETIGHKCKGFFKRINNETVEVRLDSWYDKSTKRNKGKTNKLFNHMEKWFVYMIEKYYEKREV